MAPASEPKVRTVVYRQWWMRQERNWEKINREKNKKTLLGDGTNKPDIAYSWRCDDKVSFDSKPQLKSTFFVDRDYDHLPLLLLPGFVSLD